MQMEATAAKDRPLCRLHCRRGGPSSWTRRRQLRCHDCPAHPFPAHRRSHQRWGLQRIAPMLPNTMQLGNNKPPSPNTIALTQLDHNNTSNCLAYLVTSWIWPRRPICASPPPPPPPLGPPIPPPTLQPPIGAAFPIQRRRRPGARPNTICCQRRQFHMRIKIILAPTSPITRNKYSTKQSPGQEKFICR